MLAEPPVPLFTKMPPLLANTTCPRNISYLYKAHTRIDRWRVKNPWQASVNNKLMGYVFSLLLGVPTPRLLACPRGALELPLKWPQHWGDFVIKPWSEHSAHGVIIIKQQVDQWSGRLVRGRNNVLAIPKYNSSYRQQTLMLEQIVQPPPGLNNSTTPDYKFFMFGGKVGAVQYVQGRGTKRECSAWYDATWTVRLDAQGCLCEGDPNCRRTGYARYRMRPCHSIRAPAMYITALRMAQRLGAALGMFYRVDMYIGPAGPILGEFTPWSLSGHAHCATYPDPCQLGRLWARHGQREGGNNDTIRPPPGFPPVTHDPHSLCKLVMRMQDTDGLEAKNTVLEAKNAALEAENEGLEAEVRRVTAEKKLEGEGGAEAKNHAAVEIGDPAE